VLSVPPQDLADEGVAIVEVAAHAPVNSPREDPDFSDRAGNDQRVDAGTDQGGDGGRRGGRARRRGLPSRWERRGGRGTLGVDPASGARGICGRVDVGRTVCHFVGYPPMFRIGGCPSARRSLAGDRGRAFLWGRGPAWISSGVPRNWGLGDGAVPPRVRARVDLLPSARETVLGAVGRSPAAAPGPSRWRRRRLRRPIATHLATRGDEERLTVRLQGQHRSDEVEPGAAVLRLPVLDRLLRVGRPEQAEPDVIHERAIDLAARLSPSPASPLHGSGKGRGYADRIFPEDQPSNRGIAPGGTDMIPWRRQLSSVNPLSP
jgi:hypothetical protein